MWSRLGLCISKVFGRFHSVLEIPRPLLTYAGSLSNELSISPTRRKSPTFSIHFSFTTLEVCSTTLKTLHEPMLWLLQANDVEWTALIHPVLLHLLNNRLHCTIITLCRGQLGAKRLQRPIRLHLTQTRVAQALIVRILSRPLQQAHPVCWAWAIKAVLTNGGVRVCRMV